MKTRCYLLLCMFVCTTAFAQHGVKGKIVDAGTGESLVGVNDTVKNESSVGTISDLDGNYSLVVSKTATLVFSYIGYISQEIPVGEKNMINVSLVEDSKTLSEVVVIGYGTMKKSDLTGSVVKADLNTMKDSPNTSIIQSLHGNVAGIQVGQVNTAGEEPTMQVRGQTTINGNKDLLIVLDGVIYNGRIGDINPSDVTSIDILKDASSKAVYGAKAANGVLMISTKSGRRGAAPRISYSSNWSFSNPTKNFRPLNREEWLRKVRDVEYEKAYTQSSGYTEINPAWEFSSSSLNISQMNGVDDGIEYDWWGNAKQTGHVYTNTINVDGGNEQVSYFLSGSFTDQAGIIKNDKYKRTTFRTNVDVRIAPWLKVGTNTFISFLDYSGECPNINSIVRMPSVVMPQNDEGEWVVSPNGGNIKNPFLAYLSDDLDKRHQINTTVYGIVNIPFIKGLSYRINYNYTTEVTNQYNYNQYEASEKGEASKYIGNTYYWLVDNIVNYSNTFGNHHLDATFVYGCNRRSGDGTRALGEQYSNTATGYNDLGQAIIQKISSSAWKESNLYQMGRFSYNYMGKYFMTGTLRRDGFSGFASNHKFGWFPSFGLGWTLSQESFMERFKHLDNLKLRASYGVTGNQTDRYSSLAKVVLGGEHSYVFGDGAVTALGSNVSTMGNVDLKWETTFEYNVGIDFACYGNRISGSIDYYNATTKNLLWNVVIPSITGFKSVRSNVGKLRNQGLEIVLNTIPVRTKDFEWSLGFNFATNQNKIISLLGEDNDKDGKEDDLISSGLFIGESIGTIYGYEIEGIWQIADKENGSIMEGFYPGTYKIKDQNNDGKISADKDRVILGHQEPAYTLGIKNRFSYKGFDLNLFINVIQGGKKGYMSYNKRPDYIGNSIGNAENQNWTNAYDYWSPRNPNAKFATVWSSPTMEGEIVQQRSFVRLQDASLGYTLEQKFIKKLGIDNLRLFMSGQNLLTFTGWDGWDPEVGLGIASTAYPVMRTYSLGIDITF